MLAGVVFFHEYCKSNNQINIFSLLKLILKKGSYLLHITFTSGAFTDHGVGTEERCYHNDELYRVYKFDWEIQNGWLYLYYSDGYTFIIEYPSVSGRYFYGTAEDGFEIRLEWVDGRSIRKK